MEGRWGAVTQRTTELPVISTASHVTGVHLPHRELASAHSHSKQSHSKVKPTSTMTCCYLATIIAHFDRPQKARIYAAFYGIK